MFLARRVAFIGYCNDGRASIRDMLRNSQLFIMKFHITIYPFPDLLHYYLCPFHGHHFGSQISIELNGMKDSLCLFHKNA